MMIRYSTPVFLFVAGLMQLIVSCSQSNQETVKDYILTEKDLIPEGVAYDTATQTIYISSTYKRKIVSISRDGIISDFIPSGQDDIKSVIGMEVDHQRKSLWVISSEAKSVLPLLEPGTRQWRSSVYQFNLADGKLIKKYILGKDSVFLNDLTVDQDGTAYATESVQNGIYRITPGEDSLRLLVRLDHYTFINGICRSDKSGYLFVSSTEGIIAVDLATKGYTLLPVSTGVNIREIDGLSFTGGYFIGHQSSKVCRFYLSDRGDRITGMDTLNSGKEFDSSTTGETGNGYYYFIVNSQIQSGVDYQNQAIKTPDSLEQIIIRRLKL